MAIIDFGIVAALPEEFEILLALFPEAEEVSGKFTWYRTRTQSINGRNYELVFAHQFGMGPLDAHHLAESLITRWDPAHILLVGIAGSFHDQVRLGDVVVSQQVFYFDPGKYSDGKIKYRPEGYPCSVSLEAIS
jgi:nucleoside phosphorylase